TLTVESTSSLSIQATNAGGDTLWTSNDFLAATGVRPIIILVDTFGPSTSQSPLQGLYATVGGTFDFPNETFTASVRILNAVPDQTAIDLYQRSAQSSTPGIVSIEADVAASSGSYTVSVQQLAIPETYQTSSGFDATTTVIGTGTLIMTNGLTTTNVVIDEDNSSVDGITTAINTADNGDATATVITDADGQIYLQIATLDYQESNQLSIVVDDDDENDSDASGLSQLATNQLNVITEAVSAQVTVNGTTVERSTNAIKDVINDVTLFILGISPVDTEVEVEITQQSLVAEDLFYSDVSPYFTTATGSVIFTATIANDPSTVLFSDRFSLEKNQHHMLAISGTGDNVSARITAEEYRPVATESRLSILHAAPSASVLDVYVLKSDVTLEGGNPAGNNIVPLVTGQFGLAPESYNLTITEAESKTVLAGPENINATANGFFRYVVLDADGGGAPLQLIQLDN
ncbi:MAG: flagellar filament capping protein FliD, partial [Gammaproteobacteria bacterium]|nr:flagellar filament capping protein FliD [Gammaproteobacteria bacterium]